MKYALNDRPASGPLLLYGLQWWVVSLPCVIILGVVVARLHYTDPGLQVFYLQKLFGLTGLALLAQVLFGHRLPLVVGPAAILLVGLAASLASGIPALYTAIGVGGAALALASAGGLMTRLRTFFTPRIVAVILILIAFTLAPTILRLVLSDPQRSTLSLGFALALALAMIVANQRLAGTWKSLTVLLGLVGGSLAWFAIAGWPAAPVHRPSPEATLFLDRLVFEPGTIVAFLLCIMALSINELGSIESIGRLVSADDLGGRSRRGLFVQGLANLAAGALGVIGPVSFALSAGLISATGCAARRTMIPAGLGLVACAFFPQAVLLFSCLPGVVMGALLLYLMAAQLASSLALLAVGPGLADFGAGLTVGLPLLVGLIIAFTPAEAFLDLPGTLQPIVENGFVMGTVVAMLLEHVIFKSRR